MLYVKVKVDLFFGSASGHSSSEKQKTGKSRGSRLASTFHLHNDLLFGDGHGHPEPDMQPATSLL